MTIKPARLLPRDATTVLCLAALGCTSGAPTMDPSDRPSAASTPSPPPPTRAREEGKAAEVGDMGIP